VAEQITWAGRTLSGTDRFGEWVTQNDKFEGWWDSPDPKGESADRPNADGEFDLPVYSQARLITIGGNFHAKSHGQLHEAMNFFTGAMSGRLTVAGHGSVQWADAKRNSGVKFTPVTDVFAQWQVRLKCVDPRKYGDMNTYTVPSSTAYTTVFHRGNAVGYPTVVVAGSMPGGYVLQSSGGAEYRVTTALTSGNPHTIDMATGLLVRGGSVVSGGVTRADIWRIQGGSTATNMRLQPITTGTATATVSMLDTYI